MSYFSRFCSQLSRIRAARERIGDRWLSNIASRYLTLRSLTSKYLISKCDDPFIRERMYNEFLTGQHRIRYEFTQDEVAYIHFPRCGGTTVERIRRSASFGELKLINVAPHMPVSILCPPSTHKYATIIRHPVRRVWSVYQLARRQPEHPWNYCSSSLERFLEEVWEVNNVYVRYLSGDLFTRSMDLNYQAALENAAKFFYIGVFEEFEDAVRGLFTKLGVAIDTDLPWSNRAQYPEMSDELSQIIQRHNKYDIRIYDELASRSHGGKPNIV